MKRIAATGGCFDFIHDGHISILKACYDLKVDEVVVFMNDDESVRRLKGEHKPVLPLEARKTLVKAIRYVDHVIVFSEDTPTEAIEWYLKGDQAARETFFWVKPASDYALSGMDENDMIKSYGGTIFYFDSPVIRSSSRIIENIKAGKPWEDVKDDEV